MNTLTAIRTFAKPGFTPARHVRIFADRWYLVTMQNIERGQGDYLGLGEGEYQELLPGNKARERRDAHLNHCNRIEEYDGQVWELLCNQYSGELRHVGYYPNSAALEAKLDERKQAHDKWIADCLAEASRMFATADAVEAGERTSIMSVQHLRESGNQCLTVADEHKDGFRCDAKRIR